MSLPIYVLPGMGADRRMYPVPWASLPQVQFIEWNLPDSSTSIADLAATVRKTSRLADECILIGSSLGGMVAAELCKLTTVRHLFLVGSAVHPREVGVLLRAAAPVANLVPFRATQSLAAQLPGELFQMFRASDPGFLRRMCRAIVSWTGYESRGETLHRLHGVRDFIIPPPTDADLLLEAGHLLAMTHAEDCVRFIRERLGLTAPRRMLV